MPKGPSSLNPLSSGVTRNLAQTGKQSPLLIAILIGTFFWGATLSSRAFVIPPEILAPVWTATAILMFALTRIHRRLTAVLAVCATFFAGTVSNFTTGIPLPTSLMFAAVNCIGGVVGAILLRRELGLDGHFHSVRNLVYLMVIGAISSAIGATFGAAVIWQLGLGEFTHSWMVWWLSNSLGVLIILPAMSELLYFRQLGPRKLRSVLVEAALISVVLAFVIFFGFRDHSALATPFFVFPLLMWAGLRLSVSGASLCSLMVTLLVLLAHGQTFSSTTELPHIGALTLVELQIFMIVAVISSLVPAAALSERRLAEKELENSRNQLQFALAAAGAGSWRWEVGADILHFGPESQRLFSLPAKTKLADFRNRLMPGDRAEVDAKLDAATQGAEYNIEYRVQLPDDSIRWIEAKGQSLETNGSTWLYGIHHDVTARKLAEETLRNRTAELESLLANSPVGLALFDKKHRFVRVNDRLVEINGLPLEAHLGKAISEVLPVNAVSVDPILDEVFRTGRTIEREIAGETPKAPGVTRYWLTGFYPVFSDSDQPIAAGAYVIEITDRKEAEKALQQSEQRFRAVAENIPQMVWVSDAQGNYSYLSPKWLEFTGTTLEQNSHGGWANTIHPDDRARSLELWNRAIATNGIFDVEYRVRRADGEYRWHFARAIPIRDSNSGQTIWFGTTIDVQDRKRAQEALIRSEKLASVGRMAATVAHEINNPLELITNLVFIASLDKNLSERARTSLATAEQELERVAHLTRQTLGFYRENTAPTNVEVSGLVKEVVELYSPKFKQRDISVDSQYARNLNTLAIAGEIRQVVSNIVSNAIDASGGGRVRIRTSRCVLNDKKCVRMTFADTGEGIAPKNLKHLFEPFFTTKETVGTGLGLWVTCEIVKRHHGSIRVRSRLGRGTVFSVFLPEQWHPNALYENQEEELGTKNSGGRR